MVSARRRARMQAVEDRSEGVPDWVWEFHLNKWASARRAAGEPFDLTRFVKERDAWRREREAWLRAHGVSREAFERMQRGRWEQLEREEPHLVLRRQ